jgi:hypothetical protein
MKNNDTVFPQPQLKIQSLYSSLVQDPYPYMDLEKRIIKYAADIGTGFIVLQQHHGIFIMYIENAVFQWTDGICRNDNELLKLTIKLRLFNDRKEYFLYKSSHQNNFSLRVREDTQSKQLNSDKIYFHDVLSPLRNSIAATISDNPNIKYMLTVRNYLAFDKASQSSRYIDSRFLSLQPLL